MSRTALVASTVFCGVILILYGAASVRKDPQTLSVFRDAYVSQVLGDDSKCFEIRVAPGERFELVFRARVPGCQEARQRNQDLNDLISPNRHFYKVVPKGKHTLRGFHGEIGTEPAYSPGFTACV